MSQKKVYVVSQVIDKDSASARYWSHDRGEWVGGREASMFEDEQTAKLLSLLIDNTEVVSFMVDADTKTAKLERITLRGQGELVFGSDGKLKAVVLHGWGKP